jgi:hypothetical protein
MGGVEFVAAGAPGASGWEPGGDGRRVQEAHPEPPVGLVEAGLAEPVEVEHRGHEQDQAGEQGDEQPGESLAEEGACRP